MYELNQDKEYEVGYDPSTTCQSFAIKAYNTHVFENTITIHWNNRVITLTVDGNPFELYRKVLPLDDFSVSINVH